MPDLTDGDGIWSLVDACTVMQNICLLFDGTGCLVRLSFR